MKLSFDACDHFPHHELAIGVQDEPIAHPGEDDASARPVFVFVRPHHGAQGGIHSPVAAPLRQGFVVARAVGETIAVRLGLIQRAACGEQPRFAVRGLDDPEYSDVRSFFRSRCHPAFHWAGHLGGLPFSASVVSSSLRPRGPGAARRA